MTKEAMLYHKHPDGDKRVVCDLCHHRCVIDNNGLGICRARRNEDGYLQTLVYGRAIALTPDPIEKKPLFHFLPGTRSLSVATVGCNFTCDFCQNHHISQYLREHNPQTPTGDRRDAGETPAVPTPPGDWVPPDEIILSAQRNQCLSISFTYTEPTIFFEYALETARLARERGIANCFVSNGFMTPEAVDAIADCLDAINVDLKTFDPVTYRKVIGGRLEGVLETIAYLREKRVWIEITTLLVDGMNDSPEEIHRIARFIADLDPNTPWHVSRFHPQYRMNDTPPTAVESIQLAIQIGREEGLRHIYSGNMRDERSESTWCPQCGTLLIARAGYTIRENRLAPDGACPSCKTLCAGIWGFKS